MARAHIHDSACERAHTVPVEITAADEHLLLDDGCQVREHQRPAKRLTVLLREQV
jgi:hypothetical protein